ncbi:hypothetical protein M422DRAFT_47481 [Sphaerobolus stellatus SS14]|uniref:Uncharacterized protein n=1 Tax=Sphaerobolus stellatus (strain SS14) TaxID=990650 RepID=A0A0C9VY94_SPHS4|nr:hypothetical protein M422DRAFT_47481 [Sphaerobolus stellatus SS14]
MHKIPSGSSADSEGRRRKSISADSPDVVTVDIIRPDWEAKLAAVRATVARRANRRIIMRQVGDRLIPIGITSGRVVQQENGEGAAEGVEASGGSGRRRRRHQQGPDINHLLGSVGLGPMAGQDLEELMVMEAMRLSLLDHEDQQRRQQAEQNNANANNTNNNNNNEPAPAPAPSTTADNTTTQPAQTSLSPPTNPASNPPSRPRSPFQLISSSPPSSDAANRRPQLSPSPTPTLAAALAAAQTASAFLNYQEEANQAQAGTSAERTPRGSRAATPDPVAGAAQREESIAESTESRDVNANEHEQDTNAAVTAAVAETKLEVDNDDVEEGTSMNPNSTREPASHSPRTEVDDPSLADMHIAAGYKPLPSSTDLSDPLLSKADEARDARQDLDTGRSEEGRV